MYRPVKKSGVEDGCHTSIYTGPNTSHPSNPADVREGRPARAGQVAFQMDPVFTASAPEEAPPPFPRFSHNQA